MNWRFCFHLLLIFVHCTYTCAHLANERKLKNGKVNCSLPSGRNEGQNEGEKVKSEKASKRKLAKAKRAG